jgi:hypothetical protein
MLYLLLHRCVYTWEDALALDRFLGAMVALQCPEFNNDDLLAFCVNFVLFVGSRENILRL